MIFKLSVIVPIFNMEMYLKNCIDSILAQNYKDLEIILVDDGSDDHSLEICREYGRLDHVTIVRQENKGLLGARLEGVRHSKSKYVTFVDADDWIAPEMYEQMMKDTEKSDYQLIISGIIRYWSEARKIYQYPALSKEEYGRNEIVNEIYPNMIWDIKKESSGLDPSLCNKVFERNLILQSLINAEKTNLYLCEDAAVMYPLMMYIKNVKVINNCFYYHRQRMENELAPYITDHCFFDKLYVFYSYMKTSMGERFYDQIEWYYLKMLNLRKNYYIHLREENSVYYPVDMMEPESEFIIYGAGDYGERLYALYKKVRFGRLVLWVDKNSANIHKEEMKISPPEEILDMEYDYIVLAIFSADTAARIRQELIKMGIPKHKIIWKKQKWSYISKEAD